MGVLMCILSVMPILFTVRCYCSKEYAMTLCMSVSVFVFVSSDSVILSKQLNVALCS